MTQTIEEHEHHFFRDPRDTEAFKELTRQYQSAERWRDLALTYERRARYLTAPHHAAERKS